MNKGVIILFFCGLLFLYSCTPASNNSENFNSALSTPETEQIIYPNYDIDIIGKWIQADGRTGFYITRNRSDEIYRQDVHTTIFKAKYAYTGFYIDEIYGNLRYTTETQAMYNINEGSLKVLPLYPFFDNAIYFKYNPSTNKFESKVDNGIATFFKEGGILNTAEEGVKNNDIKVSNEKSTEQKPIDWDYVLGITEEDKERVLGEMEKELVPNTSVFVESSGSESTHEEIFTIVDEMPQFPGGAGAIIKWIKDKQEVFGFPQTQTSIQCYTTFIVDRDGVVKDVKILQESSCSECDNIALQIIKSMPKWTPGKHNGCKVSVQYNLPIKFKATKCFTNIKL